MTIKESIYINIDRLVDVTKIRKYSIMVTKE